MYIVGIKTNDKLEIIGKESTRKKLRLSVLPYPENGSLEEKKAWYQTYKKLIKLYKHYGRANNMAKHIESNYKVDGCEVIEITDDIMLNEFNGCPKCGSFDVIEESSVRCTRPLSFDKSDMSFMQMDHSELSTGNSITGYECSQCGEDLSEFDFDAFTIDKTLNNFK